MKPYPTSGSGVPPTGAAPLEVTTATGGATVEGGTFAANVASFARLLRRAGIDVEPGHTALFLRALTGVGLEHRADVRTAGRAIFVHRREDASTYDAAFDLFWRRPGSAGEPAVRLPRIWQGQRGSLAESAAPTDEGATRETLTTARMASAGTREVLRAADFASLTPAEARDAQAMLEALRPNLPLRRSRRVRPARSGSRPAARSMLRGALATGGEALRWRWLRRKFRPRPIVLVCDISGSMERYSRFMLRFAHALQRSGAHVEVFVFGTRLTRITRELRIRSADEALRRVAHRVVDWSGGTLIGESLRQLNRAWVRRSVRSSAVVLLMSDGWERGDPALLARELATLRRSCHRLIWINPLAARPGFEPATAGLRAALPHVDDLVPAASVASLAALAERLGDL